MDAQLVWNTWRRILKDDQLVAKVLCPGEAGVGETSGLSAGEIAILADYASTPAATDSNIGMYRRGLVRNALGALSLVPLTRRLLHAGGAEVDDIAADFVKSTGYRDDGPNFWKIAGDLIEYLMNLPEFAPRVRQDVLALDSAAVALARRLGRSAPAMWPDNAAATTSAAGRLVDCDTAHLVASPAAVVVSSAYDLTSWIENPADFDADEDLQPSTRHWLIYFAAADAAPAYAELSERTARVFRLLATPKSASELSRGLGLPCAEVVGVIDSLAELGVVIRMDAPALVSAESLSATE